MIHIQRVRKRPAEAPREDEATLTPGKFFKTVGNAWPLAASFSSPGQAKNLCCAAREGHARCDFGRGLPLLPVGSHPLGDGPGPAGGGQPVLGRQIASLEAEKSAEAAAILFAQHFAENLDQIRNR